MSQRHGLSGTRREYLIGQTNVATASAVHHRDGWQIDQIRGIYMDAATENIADALKALSDPTRLSLLKLLCLQRETEKHTVSQLGEKLGIAQPNVSHHIKILKHAGFVRCEKRGSCAYYVADRNRFDEIASFIKEFNDSDQTPGG